MIQQNFLTVKLKAMPFQIFKSMKQLCCSVSPSGPASISSVPGRPAPASVATVASIVTSGAAPVPGTGRPLVAILGVGAVSAEVASLAALVASHARVKAPAASSPCPRPSHRDPHPPAADVEAVRRPASLVGVLLALKHDEGKAGNTPGHPDLLNWTELGERGLNVPLGGVTVKICHMETHPVHIWGG